MGGLASRREAEAEAIIIRYCSCISADTSSSLEIIPSISEGSTSDTSPCSRNYTDWISSQFGRVNSRPASFLILTLLPTCSMKRASKVPASELVQVRIGSSACRKSDSRIEDNVNRISLYLAPQSKEAHLSKVLEVSYSINRLMSLCY